MSWVIAQANPGRKLAVILLVPAMLANVVTLLFVAIMVRMRAGRVFRWGLEALSYAMWLILSLALAAPPLTQWRDLLIDDGKDAILGVVLVLALGIGGLVLLTGAACAQHRPRLGMACLLAIAGAGDVVASELGMLSFAGVASRLGAYVVQGVVLALAYAGYMMHMCTPQRDLEADAT